MAYLAIDLGTTFVKGAVLDLDTLSIGQISRRAFPDALTGLPSLVYEVDPQAIVRADDGSGARTGGPCTRLPWFGCM